MYIIGHRGAKGLAPENTLAALEQGIASGADELEIDVRVASDGQVVLHHDKHIRLNGRRVKISALSRKELRSVAPDIPTLSEAIKCVAGRVPLRVEIKPGEPATPIVAVLKSHFLMGTDPQDIIITSFDYKVLCEIHQSLPGVALDVLELWSGIRATHRARRLGTKSISMYHRVMWWGFISSMHRHGWQLTAWTLNNPQKARRWKKYGLHGVITDFPDRFTHR